MDPALIAAGVPSGFDYDTSYVVYSNYQRMYGRQPQDDNQRVTVNGNMTMDFGPLRLKFGTQAYEYEGHSYSWSRVYGGTDGSYINEADFQMGYVNARYTISPLSYIKASLSQQSYESTTGNENYLEDIEAFNLIRGDSIDIMFDITGVTSFNRVSLFKNRLAPKQISWLGYCNTSGLDNMDYLITDKNLIYEDEKNSYSEKIIYLPNIWNCHSGLNSVRSPSVAPFLKEKNITFGSFNNFNKINDRVINVWSQILLKVKNSKLILKSSLKIDKSFLKKEFEKYGVIDSIIFLEKRKLESHYNLYKKIDIALDTFPYNGVTTTFEALSMGVPVITMTGYNFNSRCGESIIKNLGIENLIANNEDDYILKAQKMAKDNEKLLELRKKIYDISHETPLFDTKQFSQDFFSILEKI